MSTHDADRLLEEYFRAEIEGMERRPAPSVEHGDRGTAGLWIARLAVAATFIIALSLPFANTERISPSTRSFTVIHEQAGTARAIGNGLVIASDFMSRYFAGGEK